MAIALILVATLLGLIVGRVAVAYLRFRRIELSFDGEKSLPILGNTLSFLGATEDDLFDRFRKMWGGRTQITRISLLWHLVLIVSDPDDIEKVVRGKNTQDKSRFYRFIENLSKYGLLNLNGNQWKVHRRALAPAFHSELLDRYQDTFDEEAKGFVERVEVGTAHDVLRSLKVHSTQTFFRTSLADVIDDAARQFLPFLYQTLDVFPRTVVSRAAQPWYWPDTLFGLTQLGRTTRALLRRVDQFSDQVLAASRERRARVSDKDFIKEKPTLIDILVDDTEMPDRHIKDEIIIFTGAAIETTVASLGWTLKTLSLRHDIQDRIVHEVREVVGDAGSVTTDHIARLEYTERVIKESLRLTPAVPIVARSNLRNPTTLDGKHVPKGTTFVINMFGAHRDPRHWEEPLRFDPDRWLPERSQGRHPYAYLPFSTGPRNCIGGRYAMAVMKTLLATVLPKYRVDPVDDGHTDPATFPMTFDTALRMPGGVHVVFTPRQPTPTACS